MRTPARATVALGVGKACVVLALTGCGGDDPSTPDRLGAGPGSSLSPASTAQAGTATTPAPAGLTVPSLVIPARLAGGQLTGLVGHRASGEAAIWRQPDGSLIVRLERFSLPNVGGLTLYLVPGVGKDRPEGRQRLGAVTANEGSANFPLPAGSQVNLPMTVLVWSEASLLPVASATAAA